MYNLDKLMVYVHETEKTVEDTQYLCGFISKLNNAILRPRLLVQCMKPLTGRYVHVEAVGLSNRWSRHFSAILCDIIIY